jgi:hypothetical protein
MLNINWIRAAGVEILDNSCPCFIVFNGIAVVFVSHIYAVFMLIFVFFRYVFFVISCLVLIRVYFFAFTPSIIFRIMQSTLQNHLL